MVVVRVKPILSVTSDKGMKPVAYGYVSKPSAAPTYPITVAQISGKGKYRVMIVGDGDSTAKFNVYVDGATTPIDSITSDVSSVIEGTFSTSVTITIEGSGLYSSYVYEVWVENTYITSVSLY